MHIVIYFYTITNAVLYFQQQGKRGTHVVVDGECPLDMCIMEPTRAVMS